MDTKTTITLYGNAGGDSELHTIPAKTYTKEVYDAIIDEVVEKEFTRSERQVRTFSLAVTKKDSDGKPVTRWIRCNDWKDLSKLVRKGDRLRVTGRFRERSYLDKNSGETKTVREFTVKDLGIERAKVREESE